MKNRDVNKANLIFLYTVLISLFAGYIIYVIFLGAKLILNIAGTNSSVVMKAYDAFTSNSSLNILLSQALLVAPALIYYFRNKKTVSLRINKINIANVFLLIILAYLIMPLMTLINLISMIFVKNEISDTINDMMDEVPLPILILLVGLLPCVCEELVYRGVVFGAHRKVNVRKAILMSGLLFGAIHMNFNQFAYAFVMGIIFAIVVEATDSIVSTMIMHFVINSNSIILNYATTKIDFFAKNISNNENALENMYSDKQQLLTVIIIYSFASLVCIVLAAALLIGIASIEGRFDKLKAIFVKSDNVVEQTGVDSNSEVNKEMYYNRKKLDKHIVTFPLILGLILAFAFMAIFELLPA